MKAILLTGGAGYIGSHTAKALAEAGYLPVTFDNLSTGHSSAVQWGPLVLGDLEDGMLLQRTIRQYDVHAVIHLAANAYVGESMTQPLRYFRNNVANVVTLLEAVEALEVQHFVFSSSCTIYGDPLILPIPETHISRPVSPYGESKLIGEQMLRWCGVSHGLQWVVLRYFNAAGADTSASIGELHTPETHLIPLVCQAAIDKSMKINLFGSAYDTDDGTAVRDYVHVTDLADAHVRALRYLEDGNKSRVFNLGSGNGHSVIDVIRAVERVSSRSVGTVMCPPRPGDPSTLIADSSAARSILGWNAVNSTLDHIVSTAWRWHSK